MFPGSDRRFVGQGIDECKGEFGKVKAYTARFHHLLFAVMATTMTLPNNPIKSKPWTTKSLKTAGFHRTACASGRKLYSRCSFVHVAEPFLAKNFR
ncbi:hypothetical protein SADUNF_Sadunf02G0122800 [Salix dunnii]|uniref:Uncharacterized protein n=1 Tax=Salix dunnii TaxID=1413687 RepID=A0A835N7T7_9ROSI|nr:hypothetical protein SADUNF_Sadunf02G0122800 [Salix dunnii]